MSARVLPARFSLPSGRRVRLAPGRRPATIGPDAGVLRAALASLDQGALLLTEGDGGAVPVDDLSLADFHVVAALAARFGLVDEAASEVVCGNCDATVFVRSCASLEAGPFVDGELEDPELDAAFDFDAAHPIPPIAYRGGTAKTLRLSPVDVRRARPLLSLAPDAPLHVTTEIARAMGVVALGDLREPRAIARALAKASDEAFDAVIGHFLAAHYPLRLSSSTPCPSCAAAVVVDVPLERELDLPPASEDASRFPSEDAFEVEVLRIARAHLRPHPEVSLVVDFGVPVCDDGGVPLLGSYVPAWEGDATSPSRPAELTLYPRTFRAMWRDDGPYDLAAEIEETITHELEHHVGALAGHDPMDLEERESIARHALRTVGRKEVARRVTRGLASDVVQFARRTWLVWVVVVIAAALTLFEAR